MGNTIYHYCSWGAFESIINNKNIRLTNAFKSNDYHEMRWIFNVMNQFGDQTTEYIEILKSIYESGLRLYQPHMMCFSYERDLLSQWRGYANHGKGVSIGFNKEYFDEIKDKIKDVEFNIYDVIYDNQKQIDEMKNIIDSLGSIEKLKNYYQYLISDNGMTTYFKSRNQEQLAMGLYEQGIRYKNPKFSEENEVRFVYGYPELRALKSMLKYRFTEDNIQSYAEIPFENNSETPPIHEIIIGPLAKVKIEDLKYFIDVLFPNNRIAFHYSECSLR